MRIAVDSDDDADLYSLYEWLSSDDAATAGAWLEMGASGARSEYQSPLDIIDVVLSNATAIAGLLVSYATWRSTRSAQPSIKVKIGKTELVVNDADEDTIKRVIEAARHEEPGLTGEDDTGR